ncbi:MAG: DNA primase [Ruminococcus sp.]|nr:DNA primase [Ruminococcus sp.]
MAYNNQNRQNQGNQNQPKKDERTPEQKRRDMFKGQLPPSWAVTDKMIDEPQFVGWYIGKYNIKQFNGRFYDMNGLQEDDVIKTNIAHEIFPYYRTRIRERVNSLFNAMKILMENGRTDKIHEDRINVANGILCYDGKFFPEKMICVNRFNFEYYSQRPENYEPEKFLAFLHELLEDDDIITLQEYLGYCLVPCTKGQSAMFIIGNGGEGKSRLGIILKEIFGSSMVTASLHRIETDKFFVSNLVDKLLMIDDDLQLQALSSTGMFKTIVTAETPIEVERKFEQSFQANIYCRFLCFGNGSPRALYDKTEGFSRRMIILSTKPKKHGRIDNPFIADDFIQEKTRIFYWMFDGLRRLVDNNFRFTLSAKTLQNRKEAVGNNCNIVEFLEDDWLEFAPESSISSVNLFNTYCSWCSHNGLEHIKREGFINWIRQNEKKYNITYSTHIMADGKYVRGFKGVYRKILF